MLCESVSTCGDVTVTSAAPSCQFFEFVLRLWIFVIVCCLFPESFKKKQFLFLSLFCFFVCVLCVFVCLFYTWIAFCELTHPLTCWSVQSVCPLLCSSSSPRRWFLQVWVGGLRFFFGFVRICCLFLFFLNWKITQNFVVHGHATHTSLNGQFKLRMRNCVLKWN